jgi:hypothetical protein
MNVGHWAIRGESVLKRRGARSSRHQVQTRINWPTRSRLPCESQENKPSQTQYTNILKAASETFVCVRENRGQDLKMLNQIF